jgi:hypothetical protein
MSSNASHSVFAHIKVGIGLPLKMTRPLSSTSIKDAPEEGARRAVDGSSRAKYESS